MTIGQLNHHIQQRLQREAKDIDAGEARAMSWLIFDNLKGWRGVDIVMHSQDEVSEWLEQKVNSIIDRVISGEPLQYVLSEANFMGMNLMVNKDVLIPRPETEALVDTVIAENKDAKDLRVMDIGTGSGCIAIALARGLVFPEVKGVDISSNALDVAKENGKKMKTPVEWIKGDILNMVPYENSLDIIVSNPPYIAEKEKKDMEPRVLDYEPEGALFVPDDDPLRFYRAIGKYALEALRPGGKLYFEINPLYSSELEKEMKRLGFTQVQTWKDDCAKTRYLKAQKP